MNSEQYDICHRTISTTIFHMLVMDALASNKPLSVVRMADGERELYLQCHEGKSSETVKAPNGYTEKWLETYGVKNITKLELQRRLDTAAMDCTYFAPSITGILNPNFNVYKLFWPPKRYYVDNFFPDQWTEQMKIDLFKQAGHVLFIHNNPHTADSMQIRVQANLNVKVNYLKLSNWDQTENIIQQANKIDAPLVLFSAGPAGKYIGPIIAKNGRIPKVTLDIGHAADRWTFSSLPCDRPKAEAFHKQWTQAKASQS